MAGRSDTLLWIGLLARSFGLYAVVRESPDGAELLGDVWRDGAPKHARWRAQRAGELALCGTFSTRRAASLAVARLP